MLLKQLFIGFIFLVGGQTAAQIGLPGIWRLCRQPLTMSNQSFIRALLFLPQFQQEFLVINPCMSFTGKIFRVKGPQELLCVNAEGFLS